MARRLHVGIAGWSIPRVSAQRCPGDGTHLERYGRVFGCAEINSSFHRPHAAATYAKWAASTPPEFRFAVKVPRLITHDLRLRRARVPLQQFLAETEALAMRRGPLLVQLPPSLDFEPRVANRFFELLRTAYEGFVVCEPRHASWFSPAADVLLARWRIARVAADPPPTKGADQPGGWTGIVYHRLHGAPGRYWSRYQADAIRSLARTLRDGPESIEAWCIFDNTAGGAAIENAWELQALLRAGESIA